MKRRVAIIGFGRFGELLAQVLSNDFSVIIYTPSKTSQQRAEQAGFKVVELAEACLADTIFLCAVISATEKLTKAMAPYLRAGSLVVDTCSVKVYPLKVMRDNLPDNVQLLGTHPLFGPDSAKETIRGQRIVFCPLRIKTSELTFWRRYWQRKGLKVLEMTADEHDRQAAFSQGLTHFMGRVLGNMQVRPYDVTTQGYEDLLDVVTQVNNDSLQLFDDLQRFNPHTKKMRTKLEKALQKTGRRLDKLTGDKTG